MKTRDELLTIVTIIVIAIVAIVTMPVTAGPVREAVTAEYKIGRTTIYEWRTGHNRLCTMVVDQYSSNAPFISCS